MKSIEYLLESENEKYNEFLQKNQDSYIFHTIEWKNVLEKTFGIKPYYILAKDSKNSIRGVLPLFYIKNFSGKKLISLPFSVFGGLIADEGYAEPLLLKAIDLKEGLNCDFIQIRQPPNNNCELLIEKNNLNKVKIRLDQQILLGHPDFLWSKLHNSCHKGIKKAQNNNVIVKKLVDEKKLKEVYKLELITKKRLGILPPSLDYYKNLWKFLHPGDYIDIFITEQDGEILSSNIFLKFKDRIIGISNATNMKGRKTSANYFMIWEAIKSSYNAGFKVFDLGSTPDVTKEPVSNEFEGILTFKNSFGTANIPYCYFYYPKNVGVNAGNLREKSFATKLGINLLKKSPICISRTIGPYFVKKTL